jgi:hypothetical protein
VSRAFVRYRYAVSRNTKIPIAETITDTMVATIGLPRNPEAKRLSRCAPTPPTTRPANSATSEVSMNTTARAFPCRKPRFGRP